VHLITSYEEEYGALDILLEGRELPVSRFSRDPDALAEMFAAAKHAKRHHCVSKRITPERYSPGLKIRD
jgi:hypothetical protein